MKEEEEEVKPSSWGPSSPILQRIQIVCFVVVVVVVATTLNFSTVKAQLIKSLEWNLLYYSAGPNAHRSAKMTFL